MMLVNGVSENPALLHTMFVLSELLTCSEVYEGCGSGP